MSKLILEVCYASGLATIALLLRSSLPLRPSYMSLWGESLWWPQRWGSGGVTEEALGEDSLVRRPTWSETSIHFLRECKQQVCGTI